MEMSRDNDRKRKDSPYMELTKKDAYIGNKMQLQNLF